jgi:hypothetical protein
MKYGVLWCVGWALAGCGGGTSGDAGPDDAGAVDADVEETTPGDADAAEDGPEEVPPPPPRICRAGTGWAPGSIAFADRSTDWGLDAAKGTTFATADIDGDGWQDLVITQGAVYARNNGKVYLNRPGAGGRRTFVDGTAASGLFRVRGSAEDGRHTSLVTFGDIDNDGDVDVFADTFAYPPEGVAYLADGPEILLNDGSGVFTLTADPAIVGPARPLASAGFFFDQDLDGNLDLFVGYWWRQPPWTSPFGQPPQLYRGSGAGGFADVTEEVGMLLVNSAENLTAGRNARPLFGATTCDVNGDGRIDVVGAAYARFANELFLADGDHFSEIGTATPNIGSDERRDFSDDQSFLCYCQANPTADGCAGIPAPMSGYPCPGRGWYPGTSDQPYSLGGNTYAHVCGDFDNDGDFDLYETNIRHPDVGSASDPSELIVNESTPGTLAFTRPGRDAMGLVPPIDLARVDEGGQNGGSLDFDNDGRLDVYLGGSPYACNKAWLFHHRSDGALSFEWVGVDGGLDHPCGNGMALADFDHDGDEDMVLGTYGCNDTTAGLPCRADWRPADNQPAIFWENVSNENNWIAIRLVGRGAGGANRSGLGALVKLTAAGVTQMRLVHATAGSQLSRDPVAFFGLGATCDIERLEVRWPNAGLTTQSFTEVLANYRIEIREGESVVRYLP